MASSKTNFERTPGNKNHIYYHLARKGESMNEHEIEMLRNALELYADALGLIEANDYAYDEFCEMRQKLSKIIEADVH